MSLSHVSLFMILICIYRKKHVTPLFYPSVLRFFLNLLTDEYLIILFC